MEKLNEGYVKGVYSGDYIAVSGKLKKGGDEVPEEKNLFLSCVSAPKINSQGSYEEDLGAWESRNYLKNLILGKVVKYSVDYTSGDNTYCQITFEGRNLNIEMVKKGLAKVNASKASEVVQKSDFFKNIKSAEAEAEKAKIGVWKTGTTTRLKIAKAEEVDCKELFEKIKGKEVDAMIEVAFNCTNYVILLKEPYNCLIKASLRFVAIPSKDNYFYKAGKSYVERLFLHRDVKLKAIHLEEKNFVVDVYDTRPNLQGVKEVKNLASSVLAQGYSKLYISNAYTNEKLDVEFAKEAQSQAQNAGLRLWEGFEKKPEKETKTVNFAEKCSTFEGVIQSVHSGDSVSIKASNGVVKRVFFSHTKAPTFARPTVEEDDKPWAWQSKEFLRKLAVGKKARAEFDFSKEMKEGRQMNFYSVIITDGDKSINLNYEIIFQGLAITNPPRGNDNDVSKYLETYLEAEGKAKEGKKGLHSTKNPGIPNYCDLIQANIKKKKEFVARNSNLKNVPCVVEYTFSATRFKLRIDKTTCFIPFKLIGLKCVDKDKNNTPQLDELFSKGAEYVNDNFLQREGVCDVVQTDKMGNYFGFLTVGGVNVGSALLKEGLAIIHNTQNNVLPTDYKKLEEKAEADKLGIWQAEGLATILRDNEVTIPTTTKYTEKDEAIKLRVVDMVDFKNMFINILPNKTLSTIEKTLSEYEAENKKGSPLEPPIKKGILCMCRYLVDGKFYRVRITAILKDDKYEVEFIDYGTIDVVEKRNLFKTDDSLSTLPPQVVECELAGLKYSKNSLTKALALYPNLIDFDNVLPGKIAYSYVTSEGKLKYGIVIFFKELTNTNETIHHNLLSKGYAKFDSKKLIGKALQDFKESEKVAKTKSLGMWTEMEESDEEQI